MNTVSTSAYLKYKNLFWGNPEVVHDVRKKKLERAPAGDGNVTSSYGVQKNLLELWLVILNMLDFIKPFVSSEFDNKLTTYHEKGRVAYQQLEDPERDARLGQSPVCADARRPGGRAGRGARYGKRVPVL